MPSAKQLPVLTGIRHRLALRVVIVGFCSFRAQARRVHRDTNRRGIGAPALIDE